jgi:hypothetical protein
MRKDSIKSRNTFTEGEPIQEPRDFNTFNIDYKKEDEKYKDLLIGICTKRLKDSLYPIANIEKYLVDNPNEFLDIEAKIKDEIDRLFFSSSNRKSEQPNQEFYTKYRITAIHRIYSSKNSKFPYCGFEQYKYLSFGIISNFLELCKHTFYFALSKEKDLHLNPQINPLIQNHSVYYVSERLFNQIDGNVPEVGPILKVLLTKLGQLIRLKMLKHTTETECNRVSLINYDEHTFRYKLLPKVIKKANTWSVFDFNSSDEAMKTKNEFSPKTDEIIINRIYCPYLEISARSRWTIPINADDLDGLMGDKSSKFFKKISSEILPTTNISKKSIDNELFDNGTDSN